jgi:hypothetical protein
MRGRLNARISVNVTIPCVFVCLFQITSALAADVINGPDSKVIERIIECVIAGKEAVLLRQSVECVEYRTGKSFLNDKNPEMPLKVDADELCAASTDEPKDWRKLSGSAIKQIANSIKSSADPRGIRILGAAFCETLDLAGLDLSYSLVIDRSLFLKGFEVRNFHTAGDLSFDGSLALDALQIMRSRIDGTVFGNDAIIKQLRILDSQVKGSLIFRGSIIPELAIFDTVSLSGELSLRGTAVSYLLVQYSTVSGVLDLTDSQARCAYVIRKSDIEDFVAVGAGFGTTSGEAGEGDTTSLYHWLRPNINPDSILATENRECRYWPISLAGNFLVSDTRVRASVCFRSFHWLVSSDGGDPSSYVALNDVTINGTSFIDLTPANSTTVGVNAEWRKFEAIGIKTSSLIFDFVAGAQLSEMSVAGLTFEHAYTAPAVTCAYDPKYFEPPSSKTQFQLGNVPDARSQFMRLPRVSEIMSWLDKNCLQTTQPLSAFIDAAKRAGDVAEATQLQIARESKELALRRQRLFGIKSDSSCKGGIAGTTAISVSPFGTAVSVVNYMNELMAVLFGLFLWLLADYGYRPQKVGWFVAATLVAAAGYFWLRLRVVGFMPVNTTAVRPIGMAFLFDRLLPAYNIREEHYKVESYYKLAFRLAKTKSPHLKHLKFLWFKIPVVKAEERDSQKVEKLLVVVKVIGIILAIFLVAAIQALVNH